MMLAAELALAKVDVAVVERRASQEIDGSRSGGLHSRTIEVLDQRGIADRFLAQGQAMQIQAFANLPGIHRDQLCQLITRNQDAPMILMLTAAGGPADRVKGSRSAPTTTSPSLSTSRSSCCASAHSPAANPRPAAEP